MLAPVTTEITTGSCTVLVRGKRSTKGWVILETGGAKATRLGHIQGKDKAIQFAMDACEPGVTATFTVRPAN